MGPKLANKIEQTSKQYSTYLVNRDILQPEIFLAVNVLEVTHPSKFIKIQTTITCCQKMFLGHNFHLCDKFSTFY